MFTPKNHEPVLPIHICPSESSYLSLAPAAQISKSSKIADDRRQLGSDRLKCRWIHEPLANVVLGEQRDRWRRGEPLLPDCQPECASQCCKFTVDSCGGIAFGQPCTRVSSDPFFGDIEGTASYESGAQCGDIEPQRLQRAPTVHFVIDNEAIEKIGQKDPTDSKLASQLERTEGGIKDVAGRLGKLEAVILNDPGKSLEMPLLRNELDHIKKGYQSDLLTLKEEIGRIYDLTKWFIGLMFTMALGVIGLAVTNFVKAGASRASIKGQLTTGCSRGPAAAADPER